MASECLPASSSSKGKQAIAGDPERCARAEKILDNFGVAKGLPGMRRAIFETRPITEPVLGSGCPGIPSR